MSWKSDKDGNHFQSKSPKGKRKSSGSGSTRSNSGKKIGKGVKTDEPNFAGWRNEPIGELSSEERMKVEDKVGSMIVSVHDGNYGYGKIYEFENGEEWYVFEDGERAEEIAKMIVEEELREDPDMFNKDFIDSHSEISDTDARLFGNDFGDMMVEDRDLDELKEMANRYGVSYDDPEDVLSGHEDDENYDEKLDVLNEKLKDKLIDEVSSERSDEVEKTIKKNGLRSFIVNNEGLCNDGEFMEQYGKWLNLNIKDAVDDAISQDGVAHFLSSYDGEEVELPNGVMLYRVN